MAKNVKGSKVDHKEKNKNIASGCVKATMSTWRTSRKGNRASAKVTG